MSNQQDPWSSQLRPLGQQFNRQHPPVLPPPATLETGAQPYYPLPSLPSLGNGSTHTPSHTFSIPSINPAKQQINQNDSARPGPEIRRPSAVGINAPSGQLPLPGSISSDQQQQQQQQQQHVQTPQQQHQQQPGVVQSPNVPIQQPSSHQASAGISSAPSSSAHQGQQQPIAVPLPETATAGQVPSQLQQGVPNRSSTAAIYRPLNVKDALSYLDQVKVQFFNQADVYNNFLDIMKDFKSQSIDTPGVIDRVSTLFRGHPNLIQGFNTFLPPGYRIECSLDPSDPNPIRVTTPTGTTTTRPSISNASYNQRWGNEDQQILQQQQSLQYQQEQQNIQQQQIAQQQQQPTGGAEEFNHAILYVNKVKTRFANQPDSYKQFLEILQTYQLEQRPIAEVYEQVTVLFAHTPDLLDDFKQFLPDTSNQTYVQQQQQPQQIQQAQSQQQHQEGFYAQPGTTSQLPPVGNFQPPTGANGTSPNGDQYPLQQQEQHQQQQQHQPPSNNYVSSESQQINPPDKKKKSISEPYLYENNYNQEAQISSVRSGNSQSKVRYARNGTIIQPLASGSTVAGPAAGVVATTNQVNAINPSLVPGIPEPVPPSASAKSSSLLEEISFFDKVKKAIGNKQSYNDFLKLLNLFSQDIIDKNTLVERVDSFIGDSHADLFNWFKMFVGYEDAPLSIENITFKKHQLELSLCKAYGPSYRQLPKAETFMPCSGRDEMCWEVLNDEWVGHPTWASEDSGFIAHRKNQYEEILFKIEEERLEFDYYMESNLRTIQTLETIANRIANMTPEQKANFKLPPGLGHNSTTIYKKVIRKIYDKDRGFEVIDALHENPAVAVPIVLKRLKQKDEEWKRAQREWNKVWREMEQKVFHKSLDHLGLTFKQADKKLLTVKQLVSEISTVKIEQQNKRLHPLTPKPQEQLNYKFTDNEVLMDIVRLADVFINRSSNYSASDREKLCQFLQSFVSLFFGISSEVVSKALADRSKGDAAASEDSSNGDSVDSDANSKKRGRENDLLKDVLKKQSKSKKEDSVEAPSGNASSNEVEEQDEVEKSSELWIKTANTKFSLKDDDSNLRKRLKYNLFCNTTIYVFFRHLRTLYERLEEIKAMNDVVGKEIRSRKFPQFAKDLNLLSHQLEDMGVQITGSKNCYLQLLDLSERLIEGEIEHQWFEESVRQGYRNKAYKIYTIDKVVQALVKHMHAMVTDSKTAEMMLLFESDRTNATSTVKDQILYRMQIRSLMTTDENMFKISFEENESTVNIQFVSLDDLTINDQENAEEKYNYYVTSYVMSHPTEGVPASKINMPFSRSFIENIDEEQCEGRAQSGLKVSVCENTYRLFFEANTQDEFTANFVYSKQPEDSQNPLEGVKALKDILEDDSLGWKHTLKEDEDATRLEEHTKRLLESGIKACDEFDRAASEATLADVTADADGDTEMRTEEEIKAVDSQKSEDNEVVAATETEVAEAASNEKSDDTTAEAKIEGEANPDAGTEPELEASSSTVAAAAAADDKADSEVPILNHVEANSAVEVAVSASTSEKAVTPPLESTSGTVVSTAVEASVKDAESAIDESVELKTSEESNPNIKNEPKEADKVILEATVSQSESALESRDGEIKPDADTTVQETNDTTIQQDANETADDTTVNHDDASIITEVQDDFSSESLKKDEQN